MARRHFLDEVIQDLRNELEDMSEAARGTFKDLVPLGHKPITRKQRVARFLGLDQQQRLQLFNELGPEQFNSFVMKQVDDLTEMVGPAAQNLIPYFFSGIPTEMDEPTPDDIMEELTDILGFNIDEPEAPV